MKILDVRGLSCPEPLLMVRGEMNTKESFKVLISEAHTKKNIENYLNEANIKFTEGEENGDYTITVER